jgi:arabinogalactan oligomer/maltooligosaccharide transport system permease protein
VVQLKLAYKLQVREETSRHINSLKEDITSLFNQNLHMTLMTLPCLGILFFNIVPLVFMISMAFTNYSKEKDHLILFDWNGLTNFGRVLNIQGNIGKQFWSVLLWTIIWAVFATFLNYIMGMILALIINRKNTHFKGFWRFCFVLSIAVPQFVSLLIMHTMLTQQGAVNVILQNLGLIDTALPFWQDPIWARVTVIVINLWVGIPYTMLQVTGILQNIPSELYEAAKMDGAGAFTIFRKITLPYMLFVTAPYLITTFTGNINNFNVIYLLSGGGPTYVGDTAGQTDLLVTWLYKLTIEKQYYNIGAVIGIMTFIVLSIVALVTYRNSASYKNEEAFM